MKEAGILPNMVTVFRQMNEPPGARFRIGHAALTMAEHGRDHEHRDVLLLVNDIFRFIRTGMGAVQSPTAWRRRARGSSPSCASPSSISSMKL